MIDTALLSKRVSEIMDEHTLSIMDIAHEMKITWITAKNIVHPSKPWKNQTIRKVKEFIKRKR